MQLELMDKHLKLFKSLSIHSSFPRHVPRFKIGDKLNIPQLGHIEGFFAIASGYNLISTSIGRYCSIAKNVTIMGINHPLNRISTSPFTYDKDFLIFKDARDQSSTNFEVKTHKGAGSPIVIENDVWKGADVRLRSGIRIGNGAVIGTKSLVTHDVSAYAIMG